MQHASNYQPIPLKLTPELLNKYINCVVDSDYAETVGRYIYKTDKSTRWTTVKKENLTKEALSSLIIKHLSHRDFYLGVSSSDKTKHLILDLDFRTTIDELNDRCNAVIDALKPALGRPNVIVQSSTKQGRHLRWMLGNPLDRQKLHLFVKRLLQNSNIELEKGFVELFPGINHKAIRLPLGNGGAILNEAYEVLWDQTTSISYGLTTYIAFCHTKVNVIKVTNHPEWGVRDVFIAKSSEPSNSDPFKQSEEVWLPLGLVNTSQKLEAIVDLAIYYWHQGLELSQTITNIQKWLKTKNNGNSKDYIENPKRELQVTIPSAVSFIYQSALEQGFRKRYDTHGFEKKYLSSSDVKRIVELTRDFDKQIWLFSLLEYIKGHQTNGQVVLHCLTMNELRGCSMSSRTSLMQYAVDLGIIELVEDYSKDRSKARLFKFNWHFGPEEVNYNSLEEYLLKTYKYADLVKTYNRYRAMLIRNYANSVEKTSNCGMLSKQRNKVKKDITEDFIEKNLWDLWTKKNSNGCL